MAAPPVTLEDRHPAWWDLARAVRRAAVSRRQFLRGAGALAAGLAAAPLVRRAGAAPSVGPATPGLGLPDLARWPSANRIKHVVVLCQENRSFDHYFGKFAAAELGTTGNRPEVFDPTTTYAASTGTKYRPFHLEYFCDFDPDHSWEGSHEKWNGGAMDGWVRAEGDRPFALGYYDAADHIYHVRLAQTFAVADHYFCSQIGPTLPNRLYLWTGTSGWRHLPLEGPDQGLPFNNPSFTGAPPTLSWPTMADVLDEARLPWKCYSVADGSVPTPIGAFNPLIFFSQVRRSPTRLARALAGIEQFFLDLALGTLPAVSWIVTEAVVSEHPPAPPDMGQLLAARVVRALMESTAWESSVLFLTYDEGGGYFDHVPPEILEVVPRGRLAGEAVGPAFRVPLIVVSPWARPGFVLTEPADHTSILRFIERTFRLPPTLEIHPARRASLSDLTPAFDFTQEPRRPLLPAPEDLFKLADETVITTDVHRGVVECSTTIPRWLPPLLGLRPLLPYPTPPPA
jgi:phospholipase C